MRQLLQLLTVQMVAGLFADMNNPRNRGPNFSWEKFPEMAAGMARTQIFLYLTCSPTEQEVASVGDLALTFAKSLVDRMQE